MAKYLPLPDGSSLKVPDEMGYQEAMALAQQQFPDLFGETKPKKTGIMGALGQGVESAISSGRTALGAVTGSPEEAAKEALKRQEALGKKYEEQVSLEKVKQAYEKDGLWSAAKEAAGQIPAAIAEQAPNMAATFGGARAGAALGSLAGPVGTIAGGVAGAALPSLIQQFGGNIERQAAEQQAKGQPTEIDRGSAAAAAVPQAALDVIGTFVPLGGRLVSKLTGIPEKALLGGAGNAAKLAEERLATTLAKGTAVGAVAEIPTEIAQQMLERSQAGLSLTDTDALAEYGKTAYQVGLLAPIGAAGRLSERGGARLEVEQQRKEEERKAAEAAEAAKNTPEALTQLDDQFRAARQQMTALNDALKVKPAKGDATAKEEYEQRKTERDTFAKDTFKPLVEEYTKRKDAIDALHAQSMATIEQAAAQGQPAVTQAIANSNAPVPVARLMDQYGQLGKQLSEVETNLSEAPDVTIQKQLEAQRADLIQRMQGLAPLIEERGGAIETEDEFQKKLAAAEKQRKDLLQLGKFDEAAKQADVVAGLQAKLPHFEELTRWQTTGAGETMPMFVAEPAQPEAKGVEYVNVQGAPVSTATTAAPVEAAPAKNIVAAQTKLADANTELATAVQSKNPEAINQALFKINEAGNEVSRTTEKQGETLKPGIVLDLFDAGNLIRTAIANGDQQTLNNLVRYEDTTKLRDTLDKNLTERDRLIKAHENRLDLGGQELTTPRKGEDAQPLRSVKRERADLFGQLFDSKQQALFKNGTYQDKELQSLYDKGGAAAVEYEVVARDAEALSKKVTTRQGRGKKSLYEELVDLAAQHDAIKAQLESGVAAPTMGEKVAGVKAKLGKGDAPAPRQMDASERYQAERRLKAIENKYRLIEGKVTPVRDQIQKLWDSLYVTKPLEKVSTVKAEKAAEAEAAARGPKAKSRTAATAARIARGDVRKEAETSQKLRDLATELGKREAGYKAFLKDRKARLDKLVARYGNDDPAVSSFKALVRDEMEAKASALGKQTPEYKAALKEQIAYFKEVLPTAGKQEVPTKRTPQVTRKQSGAPKELRVAGSRMTERDVDAAVKEVNDMDGGTAYRLREGETATTVDAAEAQKVIDGLKLPENVKFVYAPTPGQIPVKLLKMMAAEGVDPTEGMVQGAVFSDGTVLVVGDQHANITDLEETIAHELIGHYGIDTIIGTDKLNAYAKKTDVIKLAEELGGKKLVAEVLSTVRANADLGRSEEVQKLQALRESIAHTEEARVTEAFREKAGRFIKELVGMVRAGLRAMGLKNLGELSTSDVFYMLRQSRKEFANKTIGPYRAADGQTAFRLRRQPSDSVVGREPGIMDKVLGNMLGLAGRVQFVDQYAALDAALKKGLSAGQISALEAANAQYLLRFGQQRSQFAGQFLTNGPVKAEHNKKDGGVETLYRSTKGTSMVDVAQALNKAKLGNETQQEDMFTVYLAGQRAKQVGWDKLNFSNPSKAEAEYKAVMAKLAADKTSEEAFKEAAKLYQQYNAGLLDFLVQTGALTSKKAAELKAISYVPFYRINNNGEVQLMIDKETPVRISNIKDEPQLKELVGGNTSILPIFTSAAQNTFMITGMGLRNQAVKETAFALNKIGIASRVAPGKGPANADVVRFKKNGEDHYAVIDTNVYGIPAELVVRGMEGIKTTLPAVIKLMGMPANLLRSFVVRNPTYAIRQIVRDPLNAWLTTGTDATPVLSSMKELASMVAGRSDVERKLMETGAISSNVYSGDEQDMAKFLKDLSAGKSGWDKAVAKLDAFAMQGDAATRAVIYKDSLAKGMSEQEALLRTLESMNFSRRGVSPSMQALSTMIPFFNAQIQGLDVLYRAFKGDMPFSEQLKIKEKMIARGLMLSAGTMAYAALMSDDEAYKRAKPEERYGNWFVYIPGVSEPVRVPIPFELGYLFKALPEAVYNMAANDEKASKALGGVAKLVAQTNPFSLPQAVKPLTEAVLGKSFFSGDIESAREKSVLATERYRDGSTEVAKAIGAVTGMAGVSPITVDYLIRGYTGPLGIAIVSLANPILASDTKAEVAQPSTKPSKLPFIGGLFQPVEGRGTLDEAYDRMTEIRQVKGTYNDMIEKGRRAEAQAFAQDYSGQMASVSVSGAVQKQLGELAKQERIIRNHPTMTTEEKDARLEKLDKIKVQIARNFLMVSDRTTRP